MSRINAPFELKDADSKGHFTGYVGIFDNVDLGDDVIVQGAFKKVKTTRDGKLRIALFHNMQLLAGKADFKQDDRGMFLDGQLNLNVSYVKDAYELMQDGTLDGMSVGFDILDGGYEFKDGIRYITEAELWEGSIVPFGMNPEAKIDSIKTYSIEDVRTLERIAKNNGCSNSAAVKIASMFKKHLSDSDLLNNPHGDREQTTAIVDIIKSSFENYSS